LINRWQAGQQRRPGLLGLEFLADSIDGSLGDVILLFRMRVPMDSARESETTAEVVAAAAGMVARLILQSIVTSLVQGVLAARKHGHTARRLNPGTDERIQCRRGAACRASSLQQAGRWLRDLGREELEGLGHESLVAVSLEAWGRAVDRVVSPPRAPRTAASSQEPTPEPPTFSVANLAVQAATLVAAGRAGATVLSGMSEHIEAAVAAAVESKKERSASRD